jgi:hypothetical protein
MTDPEPEPGDDPRDPQWDERATEPAGDFRHGPGSARAERARPDQASPTDPEDIGGDLWSAPMSALSIDEDGLFAAYDRGPVADVALPQHAEDKAEDGAEDRAEDGMRPDSSPSAPVPDSGSPRSGERGPRRSGALALAIAVVILITLGLTAQWLAPSTGTDGGASDSGVFGGRASDSRASEGRASEGRASEGREPVTGNSEPSAPPSPTRSLSSPATLERSHQSVVVTSGSRDCPMRLVQNRQQEPAASPGERYRCFFIQ